MTDELTNALVLADKLLDAPNADPDDDLRVLSRQLLRCYEANRELRRCVEQAVKSADTIRQLAISMIGVE